MSRAFRISLWLMLLITNKSFSQTNTFPSSGSVGIGTTYPSYPLEVYGPEGQFKATFRGPDGAIQIGPANSGWAHIYTDRPNFIFNQNLYAFPGGFSSFSTSDLTLQTNGNIRLTVRNANGNVGIGTQTPNSKLEVVGPTTGSGPTITAAGGGDVVLNPGGSLFLDGNYSYASGNYIRPSGGSNTQGFFTSGLQRMRINADGKIGIGTQSPDQLLTVKGKIHAEEVIVDLAVPAPDYVFEQSYNLKPLDEVKKYIDENKHLPEVPSAKEMEKDGVKVGEMEMILLKKIEELTLYAIELHRRNETMEKQNEELRKLLTERLEAIEKKIND